MVSSRAATVEEYLAELPPERREVIAAVRDEILRNLPPGYREAMNWGMISYEIPLERFPQTYNGQPLAYLALASQKNHSALYAMSLYMDKEKLEWFRGEFRKAGKKLDMGKSCIRFRTLDDLPLGAVEQLVAGTTVKEFIAIYEKARR